MKISYKEFLDLQAIPEVSLYLILGGPYHLQNEVQHRIERVLNDDDTNIKNFIVDSDFSIDSFKSELELMPLFEPKRLIILNIVSNSMPKNLSDMIMNFVIPKDISIIIKLDTQTASFKKTKTFEYFLKSYFIIEVLELKGIMLKNWVKQKFVKNKIKYSDEFFERLLEKNEGNTSAISQELYKMSLLNISDINAYFNYLQKEYKFSEYDLINSLLETDLQKSIKILKYLKSVKAPEVYILFLLNMEIKKIYSLAGDLSPSPYIPNYKKSTYSRLVNNINTQILESLMELCYFIDKSIKTGVNNINIWHQLEILISSFILNKSPKYFLNINN